jgi:GxxExxY protein
LALAQQRGITVWYDAIIIGEYTADLLIEEVVLVELKAIKALDESHRGRCLNYLKATGLRLCLLLNFGMSRMEIQCVVFGL